MLFLSPLCFCVVPVPACYITSSEDAPAYFPSTPPTKLCHCLQLPSTSLRPQSATSLSLPPHRLPFLYKPVSGKAPDFFGCPVVLLYSLHWYNVVLHVSPGSTPESSVTWNITNIAMLYLLRSVDLWGDREVKAKHKSWAFTAGCNWYVNTTCCREACDRWIDVFMVNSYMLIYSRFCCLIYVCI